MLAVTSWAAAGQVYRLQVDGLACPFCAYGIEKQMSHTQGVKGVDVDLQSGQVLVTMDGDNRLDEATARQQVKTAGFTLRGFSAAPGGE